MTLSDLQGDSPILQAFSNAIFSCSYAAVEKLSTDLDSSCGPSAIAKPLVDSVIDFGVTTVVIIGYSL